MKKKTVPPQTSNDGSSKLYYTSFWDKFGMNINYFGMHPKTKKKVWDGSQVKAFPKFGSIPIAYKHPKNIPKSK